MMKNFIIYIFCFISLVCNYLSAQEDCLDFSNLIGDSVELLTGYDTESHQCSVQDTDWFKSFDDTNLLDALTDNNVRIIPYGETHSVRVGRIEEPDQYDQKRVSYTINVDTSNFDVLKLQYAVYGTRPSICFSVLIYEVAENKEHTECYVRKYVNADNNWKQSQNGGSYRDWDYFYFDLAPFHNKQIEVRVIMSVGEYEVGYAYYTLNCMKMDVQQISPICETSTITLSATDGFDYSWHKKDSTEVLSTNNTIDIDVTELDNEYNEYVCTFIPDEDNGCPFERSFFVQKNIPQHYNDTIFVALCDTGYYDNNFSVDSSGFYTQTLQSIYGCDSIVNLDFTRWPVFRDTIEVQIYKGQTYIDENFSETESGMYEKRFADTNGCDSLFVLNLNVIELKFPNVVTPNGDGINDMFEVFNADTVILFDEMLLKIYNRAGKQIFEQTNFKEKSKCWDPIETNTPTGTYFYRFIAKGRSKNIDITGVIEVLYE